MEPITAALSSFWPMAAGYFWTWEWEVTITTDTETHTEVDTITYTLQEPVTVGNDTYYPILGTDNQGSEIVDPDEYSIAILGDTLMALLSSGSLDDVILYTPLAIGEEFEYFDCEGYACRNVILGSNLRRRVPAGEFQCLKVKWERVDLDDIAHFYLAEDIGLVYSEEEFVCPCWTLESEMKLIDYSVD
jgi:hypothetical protein